MKHIALLAFVVNLTGTLIAQIGLLLMKQAHKSLEQLQTTVNDNDYVNQ